MLLFLKFVRCIVEEKHLMRFQSYNALFSLLWRSVDGALLVGRDKHNYLA